MHEREKTGVRDKYVLESMGLRVEIVFSSVSVSGGKESGCQKRSGAMGLDRLLSIFFTSI